MGCAGQSYRFADALAALCGHGLPVLPVCRPGSLAYFEPEYEFGAGKRFGICRAGSGEVKARASSSE